MDPVSQSLFGLGDRIAQYGANKRRDELKAADLGLNRAELGLRIRQNEQQQQAELAKAQRDKFMNEEVTARQAIMTHPKLSDEQKQSAITMFEKGFGPKESGVFLDTFMYPRKSWAEALRKSYDDLQNRRIKEKELGVKEKTAKDTRGTMQKDVEFIQSVRGSDSKAALDEYLKNKSLGERIRLFNNELNRLADDPSFQYDMSDAEKAKKVDDLRNTYQITDVMNAESPTNGMELTRDKAMEYLKSAGGDKQKARDLAKKDGYQF